MQRTMASHNFLQFNYVPTTTLLFSSGLYLRCSKSIYTNLENVFSNDYRNTKVRPFLTRELRACARASYRYHVGNGIRSLDWSIPVNFF